MKTLNSYLDRPEISRNASFALLFGNQCLVSLHFAWSNKLLEEVTLDLVGNDFSAVVNDFGIPDGRECIPDGRE